MNKNDYAEVFKYLQEKRTELLEEAKEDTAIDWSKPDTFQNNTLITIKWIALYSEWNKLYRYYDKELRITKKKRLEYYTKNLSSTLSIKEYLTLYVVADTEYQLIESVCNLVKDTMQDIDCIKTALKDRGWEINRWLEYQKFINGK